MRRTPRSLWLWGGLFLGSLLLVGAGVLWLRFASEAHPDSVRSPLEPPALVRAKAAARAHPRPLARRVAEPELPGAKPELEPPEPPPAFSGELATLPAEDRNLGMASVPAGAIAPDFQVPDPPPPMPFEPENEAEDE